MLTHWAEKVILKVTGQRLADQVNAIGRRKKMGELEVGGSQYSWKRKTRR